MPYREERCKPGSEKVVRPMRNSENKSGDGQNQSDFVIRRLPDFLIEKPPPCLAAFPSFLQLSCMFQEQSESIYASTKRRERSKINPAAPKKKQKDPHRNAGPSNLTSQNYAENDVPQPQPPVAFGFSNVKPDPIILVV